MATKSSTWPDSAIMQRLQASRLWSIPDIYHCLALEALALLFSCTCMCFLLLHWRPLKQQVPLPPGPPGWHVIGNYLDWSTPDQTEVFSQWADKYGPITHVSFLRQAFTIHHSSKAANDLLKKRSANYSDRPLTTMLDEIICFTKWSLPFMPYNDRWRAYRKQFHSAFRPRELKVLRPLILGAVDQFLQCLATDPDQFCAHIRSYTSNVLSKSVYGPREYSRPDAHLVERKPR